MSASSSLCKQPVVAIVGHIDHGKTTLLDYIRKSSVAAKETGGITQRVSAYEVVHDGSEGTRSITFIDTPGHEAFQKMRARGAKAADIAILVIAADDGVKPQTIEAYKAIEEAKVPFIVAFTKVDKDTANIERAKESVMKQGIYLEGLGGDIPYAQVSGKSGLGVPELLDLIILVSDLNNITCDAGAPTQATVIESSRDARTGISATVIVKQGTLSTGGFAVAGSAMAPLRSIEDFTGAKVSSIACGKPARITGFTEEPPVGSIVTMVLNKKEAEETVLKNRKPVSNERTAVDNSLDRITIRIGLKADTAGSLEALEYELGKISAENVDILVVSKGVGPLMESDIKPLVGFSPAFVLGFNVKVDGSARDFAERQHITLETRNIIYELTDWLKAEVIKFVPEVKTDAITGTVNIIRYFSTAGSKHVVGGKVITGILELSDRVNIMRRGIEIGQGKVVNLQMQRADVSSVPEGMEFGAQIETKADLIAGDQLQAIHKPRS